MDEDVSKEPRDIVTGGPRDGCITITPDGDLPTFHIQIYDPIYSYQPPSFAIFSIKRR